MSGELVKGDLENIPKETGEEEPWNSPPPPSEPGGADDRVEEVDGADRQFSVFLCYRRVDGDPYAELLYNALHGRRLPGAWPEGLKAPVVYVFRDTRAAAGPDWVEQHRPHLEAADCLIYIATPGACVQRGSGQDWVQHELAIWLQQHSYPPIVVNPYETPVEGLFVPDAIKRRWPNLNRVDFPTIHSLYNLDPWRRKQVVDSAVQPILRGMAESAGAILDHNAARRLAEIRRLRALQHRTRWALVVTGAMAVVFFGAMVFAGYSWQHTLEAEARAQELIGKLGESQKDLIDANAKLKTVNSELVKREEALEGVLDQLGVTQEDRDRLAEGTIELTEELRATAGNVVMLQRRLRSEEKERRETEQELDDKEQMVAGLQVSVTGLQGLVRQLTSELNTVKGTLSAERIAHQTAAERHATALASERSAKDAAVLAAATVQKRLDEHQCPQPPPSAQGQQPPNQEGATGGTDVAATPAVGTEAPTPTDPSSTSTSGDAGATLATGS